ncbi:MAG: SDR family oxidoreductase [Polyangiales bacterium]
MKVLVLGIAGGVGRVVAKQLLERGHEVIGIDARAWPDAPKEIDLHEIDLRKRGAEDIFRTRRPEVMVHMATVTSLVMQGEERHRINLGGTRAAFEHCKHHGVRHAVFVGRHTFYGAAADSPLFHTEDEPPIGLASFPELIDLVAADLYAASAMWRIPEMTTTVLRTVYTLGPSGHGTLASFLHGARVPTVLGFDPLFHFMHEDDAARAIVLATEKQVRGVFNVCGPQPLPLSTVIARTGRKAMPLPEMLMESMIGRFGLPKLPRGALSHVKYPIVVDGTAFKRALGFEHHIDEAATLASYQAAFPPPRD